MDLRIGRQRGSRAGFCAWSLLAAFLVAGAPNAVADEAAWLYEPATVAAIELRLPPSSVTALEADPTGSYQPGTFALAATDGTPAGSGVFSPPIEVGIRLKGGLGSLRTLGEKAAFKVKFDEFVKGQTFLGLKKMTLNNMVQDPSMVHEVLAYELFRALGVPAPRAGYAYLRVNGEDFGLHLNVETLDKVGLEKRFGSFQEPPQHLYEGEYGADVTTAMAGKLEVDEGKKKERVDLEALVAAVEGGASGWRLRVEPHADLAEMARMWAVEKYTGHWDGYSGDAGPTLPNNYYLYSDPAGRFQMLPWGTDQTWENHLPFTGAGGVLFEDCLQFSETCAGIYRAAAADVLQGASALDLGGSARCAAVLLRPWQEREMSSGRHPYDLDEIAAGVQRTLGFIAARPAELADWLGVAAPAATGDGACPAAVALAPSADPGRRSRTLRLGRAHVSHGMLSARVWAPGAGALSLAATIGSREGRRVTVCGSDVKVRRAGGARIHCVFAAPARERLSRRALRTVLRVRLDPTIGPTEARARAVTLPRRPTD